MVRYSFCAIFVAYVGFAAIKTVIAGPTVGEFNSTQIIPSVYKPTPKNPFVGLTLDFEYSPLDMDLVTRSVSEADLESRQVAQIARVAVKVISKIVDLVKGIIEKDKKRRAHFTNEVVDAGTKAHPEFNWIVCHPKHHYNFKGVKGKDWDHEHKEFDVSFHKTVGYEVYYLREGEFWLEGDGDYINVSILRQIGFRGSFLLTACIYL
ncbi:hypothetical protein H0H93_007667 [Arthromyces matolae]|nr:hypothetical protein H0H93_007667 [Arthromyces matolae]